MRKCLHGFMVRGTYECRHMATIYAKSNNNLWRHMTDYIFRAILESVYASRVLALVLAYFNPITCLRAYFGIQFGLLLCT